MPVDDERGDEAPEQCVGERDVGVAGQALALGLRVELVHGQARVREELGVGQRGLDDQAGRGAEARIAGRQGELVGDDVVDHGGVAGRDDEALGGVVDEDALQRGEDDRVADLDRIEVVEGMAVGGAVAGDGGVAGLAGQGRAGVVARALAEVGRVRALDHDLVDADDRDPDVADRLPSAGAVVAARPPEARSAACRARTPAARARRDGVVVGLLLRAGCAARTGCGPPARTCPRSGTP